LSLQKKLETWKRQFLAKWQSTPETIAHVIQIGWIFLLGSLLAIGWGRGTGFWADLFAIDQTFSPLMWVMRLWSLATIASTIFLHLRSLRNGVWKQSKDAVTVLSLTIFLALSFVVEPYTTTANSQNWNWQLNAPNEDYLVIEHRRVAKDSSIYKLPVQKLREGMEFHHKNWNFKLRVVGIFERAYIADASSRTIDAKGRLRLGSQASQGYAKENQLSMFSGVIPKEQQQNPLGLIVSIQPVGANQSYTLMLYSGNEPTFPFQEIIPGQPDVIVALMEKTIRTSNRWKLMPKAPQLEILTSDLSKRRILDLHPYQWISFGDMIFMVHSIPATEPGEAESLEFAVFRPAFAAIILLLSFVTGIVLNIASIIPLRNDS